MGCEDARCVRLTVTQDIDGFDARTSRMKNIIRKLGVGCPGPDWDGKTFVRIEGKVGFEPHGRASECWESYFVLTLPTIPAHTHYLDGWKEVPVKWGSRPMSFQGRTIEDVVAQANAFLDSIKPS